MAVRLAEVDPAHQPSRIDDDDLQHQNGTPTTRFHAASGRTPFVSMWTVTLSSLKQCAKTYEIRRTPTPVRVTEALQAAVLEGVARPARARARDFYWLGTSSTGPGLITTAGAQLPAAILRDGARS